MDDIKAGIDGAEEVAVDLDVEVRRLADLPRLEYERERKSVAKRLGIDRVTVLDDEVTRARPTDSDGQNEGSGGRAISLPEPDPWPDPVDGDSLLHDVTQAIRQYLYLPAHADHALALWAVHTHLFESFDTTPRFMLISPLPSCGKSTALRVLHRLVNRPLLSGNISTSAVFRTVEAVRPTLLIDEADTFARKSDELRGVLNSGHEADGSVIRVEGEDREPQQYSTFSPVAIACIDRLPATIESRSIIIEMTRKPVGVKLARLRSRKKCDLDQLAGKIARWVQDNRAGLDDADPDMPDELDDRQQDNWRPLCAIADLVGADWPATVRRDALALSSRDADNEPARVMLLSDLREIFSDQDALFTQDILRRLHDMDSRPWREWGRKAVPITDIQLSRQLRAFKIRPDTVFIAGAKAKGYRRQALETPFQQYLPPEGGIRAVDPLTPAENKASSDIQPVDSFDQSTGQNRLKPTEMAEVNGSTGQMGGAGDSMPNNDDIERTAIQSEGDFA